MVIFFTDLLGVKSLWQRGGRAAAEHSFVVFRTAVVAALRNTAVTGLVEGAIETDATTLVFESPVQAVKAGMALYNTIFDGATTEASERWWLRGVILPLEPAEGLRLPRALSTPLSQVHFVQYAGSLLDAIAIEKSGVKGMRLLISNDLVTPELREHFRIAVGPRFLIPFRPLDHSSYPATIATTYQDVLWMLTHEQALWESRRQLMASRLRWSARDTEESVQAAATQVLFNEAQQILGSLQARDL